jgi:membrane-associated phospholipid phosphatase
MDKFYRNGFRLLSACVIICCSILTSVRLPASETPVTEDANSSGILAAAQSEVKEILEETLQLESAKVDLYNFPKRFIEDSKYTFLKTDNVVALLLAGGASIAMHNTDADDSIQDDFKHHQFFHKFTDESLNIIGSPASHFPAAGLWYVLAAQNNDELNKGRAFTMITALSINGAVTLGLKAIRNNRTPNNEGWGWPSGHTSSSFTVASVLHEFYGPKVGIPAYILASFVAFRMMDTGDHWASDCVFGATLGWVVGHSVAGKHKQLEIAGFDVLPYMAPTPNNNTAMGVGLVKQF